MAEGNANAAEILLISWEDKRSSEKCNNLVLYTHSFAKKNFGLKQKRSNLRSVSSCGFHDCSSSGLF